MSYILDALRRAEAERERGAVPGVHTEQFPSMPDTDDDAPRRPVALIATVAVLALALAGVVAWLALGGREPARPVVVAGGAVTPGIGVAPPMAAPASAPTSTAVAPLIAAPPPSAAAASTPPPVASKPTVARALPERRVASPSTTPPPTTTATAPAAEPAPDRVYTEAELPDAAKRAMPKLAFGGSAWSSAPSSRMVIWNGRVFHEGDTVAPGVVLKRIDRKSAQIAVRGYRIDVPF